MTHGEKKPVPAGVLWTEEGVSFSVAVPKGKKCRLCLYRGKKAEPYREIEMEEDILYGDIRSSGVQTGIRNGDEYLYFIDGEPYVDPYAHGISRHTQAVQGEQETVDTRALLCAPDFNWEGDRPLDLPDEEIIAYSLHVRGYTKNSASKVKAKGTFGGIIEKIPYLQELGINQIQCMPVYEFEDQIRLVSNYWGYGEAYCFAPKSRYAKSNPVRELKEMVKACHLAGIEVVLHLPFYEGMPKQKMTECLRFYRQEFHVDGFIVNPYTVPLDVIESDDYLKNMKLLVKNEEFQTVMRRFLKGDEGMIESVIWHLKHLSQKEHQYHYITDQTGFTLCDLVSYDGKHNEQNGENNHDGPDYNYSWNCGVEGPTRRKAVVKLREQQMRNAFFLLLMAQGTPCILAGDEFANSQNGNNNVYCQDNDTAWVNWKKAEKEKWLIEYVKKLIRFRKDHRILHPAEECQGIDLTHCGIPDVSYHGENAWQVPNEIASRQLGVFYSGAAKGEQDLYIAYNMHWEDHTFALPSLPKGKQWKMIFTTAVPEGFLGEREEKCMERKAVIEARSIAVFTGDNDDSELTKTK
nr:alpha-amylase family glycosyl hydrolase [uncultured Sellimonas sp.]